MKAKFGAIVVAGRGKIGGHVASSNTYGAYFRTKVTPSNPKTDYQIQIRSNLSTLSKAWSGLSDAQRAAWSSSAALASRKNVFGDSSSLTGFNYFVKLNGIILNVGGSIKTDAPTQVSVSQASITSCVASADDQKITTVITPATAPSDCVALVSATEQLSAGVSYAANKFRNVKTFTTWTAGSLALQTEYTDRFGSLTLGKKVFVKVAIVNKVTGGLALPVVTSAIVS